MSGSGDGRLPTFSPLAIDLRAALSPRALTRARYGGAALGLPSRASQLVPVQRPNDGAECAREELIAGAAAKAPTQRAARRNRRRMWSLGLRLDAQGGGGGGGGGDRSYLCSTLSSRGPRHRARRCTEHAGSMPPASPTPRRAPTGTVARKRRCKAMWDGIRAVVP